MRVETIMMLLVGTIVYSGAQMCAPEDDFCLYMQKIGEAVKVSFHEIHQTVFNSVFCLFVKVVVRQEQNCCRGWEGL